MTYNLVRLDVASKFQKLIEIFPNITQKRLEDEEVEEGVPDEFIVYYKFSSSFLMILGSNYGTSYG